ncbi:MAG: hypothetical protein KGK07_06700, partial [Chloroflexota bacterium]|nr:hypothetical protein [Chloroflexota bacterium]
MINRFTAIGAAAVVAALALFGVSAGSRTAGAASAISGTFTPSSTSTSTPAFTATPCGGIIFSSYDPQAAPCTPVPPPVRTATPTATQAVATNTALATATVAPSTSVPNTPV